VIAGALLALVPGCDHGCEPGWLREHGVPGSWPPARGEGRPGESPPPGSLAMNVVDCPDGLARCSDGRVEVTRLATIPQPCRGPQSACGCPWAYVAECDRGCVADGLEVVMDRARAPVQLCADGADGADRAHAVIAAAEEGERGERAGVGLVECDEGELYRCVGDGVVDCARRAVVARCLRGCSAESASVEDGLEDGIEGHRVTREAAFAILCSR
jgi:hypothetical protein